MFPLVRAGARGAPVCAAVALVEAFAVTGGTSWLLWVHASRVWQCGLQR